MGKKDEASEANIFNLGNFSLKHLKSQLSRKAFQKFDEDLEFADEISFDLFPEEIGVVFKVETYSNPFPFDIGNRDRDFYRYHAPVFGNESYEVLIHKTGTFRFLEGKQRTQSQIALFYLHKIMSASWTDSNEIFIKNCQAIRLCLLAYFSNDHSEIPQLTSFFWSERDFKQTNNQQLPHSHSLSYTIRPERVLTSPDICFHLFEKKYQEVKNSVYLPDETNHLFLCFNDESAISLEDYLFHPYSWFNYELNRIIFDFFGNYNSLLSKSDQAKNFKSLPHFIKKVLSDKQISHPLLLGWQVGKSLINTEESLEVRDLHFLEPSNLSIHANENSLLNGSDLVLTLEEENSNQTGDIDLNNAYYRPGDKSLHIKSEVRPADNFIKELHKKCGFIFKTPAESSEKTACFQDYPDHEVLERLIRKHDSKFHFNVKNHSQPLQPHVHINFNSKDLHSLDVAFSAQTNDSTPIFLGKRSQTFRNLLRCLSHGFCGSLHKEAKELSTRNPLQRSHELKLYKHQGLCLMLINEAVLQLQVSLSKKLFQEKISSKAAGFISYLINNDFTDQNTTLESLIKSKTVSERFIKNLNKFMNLLHSVFTEKSSFLISGTVYKLDLGPMNQNFFLWIAQHQLRSAPPNKKFFKARYPDLQIESEYFTKKILISDQKKCKRFYRHTSKLPFNIQDALPFASVSIDGQDIESLDQKDIQTELRVNATNKIDWFEMNPKYFFNGVEVPAPLASQCLSGEVIEFQGKFYHITSKALPSLKWLNHFWNKIQGLTNKKNQNYDSDKAEVHLQRSQILEMLALKRAGVDVKGDERWQEISKNFENLDSQKDLFSDEISSSMKSFQGKLKPFQLEGLKWLRSLYGLGLGGLLSDDMGLGKTVQSIAFLNLLNSENRLETSLIVVPPSLVYNWSHEFKKFAPNLKMEIFEANKKEQLTQLLDSKDKDKAPQVLITTYGLLKEHKDFFLQQKWHLIFFDEAQNIKNIKAKRTQACRELQALNKYALTGTPLENHFGEFYSIMDLVSPGSLGSYKAFMEEFNFKDQVTHNFEIDKERVHFLKAKVRPLVLRRTKAQVLHDLPKKSESILTIPFEPQQIKVYKNVALSYNNQVQKTIEEIGEKGAQLQMLTALLRLRQICSCPHSVPNITYKGDSPKITLAIEKIKELVENDHSVVVFTNFISTLEYLKKSLQDQKMDILSLQGSDPIKKRRETLAEFDNNPKAQVLIMTLKTGGVGLNLTKANYVFHIEPWWNPAAENQGTDRVHRIGQQKSVQVYRYIMGDSIEEKIQTLKKRKQMAFDAIFSESVETSTGDDKVQFSSWKINQKDFQELLGF